MLSIVWGVVHALVLCVVRSSGAVILVFGGTVHAWRGRGHHLVWSHSVWAAREAWATRTRSEWTAEIEGRIGRRWRSGVTWNVQASCPLGHTPFIHLELHMLRLPGRSQGEMSISGSHEGSENNGIYLHMRGHWMIVHRVAHLRNTHRRLSHNP